MDNDFIKKIMESSYDFDDATTNTRNIETLKNALVEKAKYSYMRNYRREEVEDAFMEALLYAYKRCLTDEEYKNNLSVSSITHKMREIAKRTKFKENGYNTRGNKYKWGRAYHIQNSYDKYGDNTIESMPEDYDWREH